MTEGKFTALIDLTADQMTALLEQCQKEQRPVQEIGTAAIANYLAQKETLAYNTAKALAD